MSERVLPSSKFEFAAPIWDLSTRATTAQSPSDHQVSFKEFRPAMALEVKNFVLTLIAERELANSSIQSALCALRQMVRCLAPAHGADFSPMTLSQRDARVLEDYFAREGGRNAREQLARIARFAEFLRDTYDGRPADFRPDPRRVPKFDLRQRPYSEGLNRLIPDDVSAAIMRAIGRIVHEETSRRVPSLRQLQNCTAIVLVLVSARRISEILRVSRKCLRSPSNIELERIGAGVWLIFTNTKTGDGAADEVYIPEPAASLVRSLTERIHRMSADLAEESGKDFLFLRRGKRQGGRPGAIGVVSQASLRLWFNGKTDEKGTVCRPGFIHRFGIRYKGRFYRLRFHQGRHTLSHAGYMRGASYIQIGDYLGHWRPRSGLSPMTGVYVHGGAKANEEIARMRSRRNKTENGDGLAKDREVRFLPPTAQEVLVSQEQGILLVPNHYGHCRLTLSGGLCVAGDLLWIGPKGMASDYACYTPTAAHTLKQDRELLLQTLEILEGETPKPAIIADLKERVRRVSLLLDEVEDAARSTPPGIAAPRPRAAITPVEPAVERSKPCAVAEQKSPQSEAKRRQRWFAQRGHVGEAERTLTDNEIQRVEAVLSARECKTLRWSIAEVARKAKVPLAGLLRHPAIVARIERHDARSLSPEQLLQQHLTECETEHKPVRIDEVAARCGLGRYAFRNGLPVWYQRFITHNKRLKSEARRHRLTQCFQELQSTKQAVTILAFCRRAKVCPKWLRRMQPALVRQIREHNRRCGWRRCSATREERARASG